MSDQHHDHGMYDVDPLHHHPPQPDIEDSPLTRHQVMQIAVTEALERVEEQMLAAGVDFETHDYVRGNTPAEDIMTAVADHGGTLIVIGIRKRSATGKLLLGSNALDVLHDATVPVLCVKASD